MEIKRRSHHNFCNLDYPLKTSIHWVYNARHTGFKKFAVCTRIKVTQFIRAQFNFFNTAATCAKGGANRARS